MEVANCHVGATQGPQWCYIGSTCAITGLEGTCDMGVFEGYLVRLPYHFSYFIGSIWMMSSGKQFTLEAPGNKKIVPLGVQSYASGPISFGGNVSEGDDDSPPNSTKATQINAFKCALTSNAGFSESPPWENFPPTRVDIECRIRNENKKTSISIDMAVEFENPYPKESMMVWIKVAKHFLCEEYDLAFVKNEFQDWDESESKWKSVNTKVAYTVSSETLMNAVLESETENQIAATSNFKGDDLSLKVGPVGRKCRILMKYGSGNMYSYAKMSLDPNLKDIGSKELLPFAIFVPWANIGSVTGKCDLSVKLVLPAEFSILDAKENVRAYEHLSMDKPLLLINKIFIQDENFKSSTDSYLKIFEFSSRSLPVSPTCFVFWLESKTVKSTMIVTNSVRISKIQYREEDRQFLKAHLPGMPSISQLMKLKFIVPRSSEDVSPSKKAYIHINMSDSSGSTSIVLNGKSMRLTFNKLLVQRFLKHLQSIPFLLEEKTIRSSDVWVEAFIIFNHQISMEDKFSVSFQVSEFQPDHLTEVFDHANSFLTGQPFPKISCDLVQRLTDIIRRIMQVKPSGGTDFSKPCDACYEWFPSLREHLFSRFQVREENFASFLFFDTDGGHNRPEDRSYLHRMKDLVRLYHIRGGSVNGYGAWLNQECASRLAKAFSGVCLLSLHVPELHSKAFDAAFKQEISNWLDCLARDTRILTIKPAPMTYAASGITRVENAFEILGVRSLSNSAVRFGAPDISNIGTTGIVLQNVTCGLEHVLYVVARDEDALKSTECFIGGKRVMIEFDEVSSELSGELEGYDWIKSLSTPSEAFERNTAMFPKQLYQRVLDDLSFHWNLPLPDSSTSFFGRTKSAYQRAPIDKAHSAKEPPSISPVNSFSDKSAFSTSVYRNPACRPFHLGGNGVPSSGALFGANISDIGSAKSSFHVGDFGSVSRNFQPVSFGASENASTFASPAKSSFRLPKSPRFANAVANCQSQGVFWYYFEAFPADESAELNSFNDALKCFNYCFKYWQHIDFHCDGCKKIHLNGGVPRYHCLDLVDYDLCIDCYKKLGENSSDRAFGRRFVLYSNISDSSRATNETNSNILKNLFPNVTEGSTCDNPLDRTVYSWIRRLQFLFLSLMEWKIFLNSKLQSLASNDELVRKISGMLEKVNAWDDWKNFNLDTLLIKEFFQATCKELQ